MRRAASATLARLGRQTSRELGGLPRGEDLPALGHASLVVAEEARQQGGQPKRSRRFGAHLAAALHLASTQQARQCIVSSALQSSRHISHCPLVTACVCWSVGLMHAVPAPHCSTCTCMSTTTACGPWASSAQGLSVTLRCTRTSELGATANWWTTWGSPLCRPAQFVCVAAAHHVLLACIRLQAPLPPSTLAAGICAGALVSAGRSVGVQALPPAADVWCSMLPCLEPGPLLPCCPATAGRQRRPGLHLQPAHGGGGSQQVGARVPQVGACTRGWPAMP